MQSLKLVSAISLYEQIVALKNEEKCFLFHLKAFSCSQDIQIFVFPPSPLFPLSAIASDRN